MEAHARDDLTLARVRAEFDQWRSGRSGRGRIPDRLWRLAVSLLGSFSVAVVCRELHLSAGDLRKHRQALDTKAERSVSATPAFVELRAVDLTPAPPTRTSGVVSLREAGAHWAPDLHQLPASSRKILEPAALKTGSSQTRCDVR